MIYAVIAAVILAIGFGSGWTTHSWKTDAETKAAIEHAEAMRAAEEMRYNDIAEKFIKKLDNLKVVNRTINNEIHRETEKTVYRECVVPDAGRELLIRAVGQANADTTDPNAAVSTPAPGAKPANDGGASNVGNTGSTGIRGLQRR